MEKLRQVKESRIKKLNGKGRHLFVEGAVEIDLERYKQEVVTEIGRKFAEKLVEFRKVKFWRTFGSIEYDATLEVIVPERLIRPKKPVPKKAGTPGKKKRTR